MRREHAARSGRPPPRSQPAGSAPALARPFVETPARASSWEPAPRRWARWPWRPPAPATVTWLPAALGRQDRGLSACGGSKNMSRTATGSSFLPSQTPRPSEVHTWWQTAHLGNACVVQSRPGRGAVPVQFMDMHGGPHTRRLLLGDHVLPTDADWDPGSWGPPGTGRLAGGSHLYLSFPVSYVVLQVSGGSPGPAEHGDSSVFAAPPSPHPQPPPLRGRPPPVPLALEPGR